MIQVNEVYCENCTATMDRMPAESVDLVITSPPYDDLRTYNGYVFDFERIALGITRILKPGGVIVWVVGDAVQDGAGETGTSFRQALFFKDTCGLWLHDTMIYEKNGTSMPDVTRYLQVFEYMFVFSKGRPKTVNFIEDRRNRYRERWGEGKVVRNKQGVMEPRRKHATKEFGRRFNIWRYFTGAGYGTKDTIAFEHPATFPEALVADHVRSWSMEGDLVYDPMGGSGTVPKVCHMLGRPWIMSEVSEKYADLARRRLAPHLQTKPLF